MEFNIKDDNIRFLKNQKRMLNNELKKLCNSDFETLSVDGTEIIGLKDQNDKEYYEDIEKTIKRIEDYLEKEKDYIVERLFKDINYTKNLIAKYGIIMFAGLDYDKDVFLDYVVPILYRKINEYTFEMDELRDYDFDKIYFDRNGIYSIGLKNSNDLELYTNLNETVKAINGFLLATKNIIRSDMYNSMATIDDIINNLERTN